MAYTDRSYCHVLSADQCLVTYTKCRNDTIWDHGWLSSPVVRELIRDVGDLSVSSCLSEFRTWTWYWSYHIPDDCTSTTSLAFLYPPLCFLSVCLWPEADTIFRMTSWSQVTHFWALLSTNLFADGNENNWFRLFCFLPRRESSPCCDPL